MSAKIKTTQLHCSDVCILFYENCQNFKNHSYNISHKSLKQIKYLGGHQCHVQDPVFLYVYVQQPTFQLTSTLDNNQTDSEIAKNMKII